MRQSNPSSNAGLPRRLGLRIAVVAVLLLAAMPALAAVPPAARTYFTVAMGLEGRYEVGAWCLRFTADGITSLDGEIAGTWVRSKPRGKEAAFTFALSLKSGGEDLAIDGQGRIDARGPGSSLAATARARMGSAELNYAFAGREVARGTCRNLVESHGKVPEPALDVVGSGRLVTEPRFVDGFRAVSLRGTGRLVIERGGSESLSITAEDNILPLLDSTVRNEVLELGIRSSGDVRPTREIDYRLTARDLEGLAVSGNAEVQAFDIDAGTLTIDIQGSAVAIVAGRAGEQKIRVSGSAAYRAGDLVSRDAAVDLSGSSHAVVRATHRIVGTVTGSSLLQYIGNPALEVQVSGSGAVVRLGG